MQAVIVREVSAPFLFIEPRLIKGQETHQFPKVLKAMATDASTRKSKEQHFEECTDNLKGTPK